MKITETGLEGLYVIEPKVFEDQRGFFTESYSKKDLAIKGINHEFVQDNHSKSRKGTLRGLHYQAWPAGQAKLIRCTKGLIMDIAVDIRPKSKTYKQYYKAFLDEDNHKQLLVPNGFAHGFLALTDVEVQYKVTSYYDVDLEVGFRWNDPAFNVEWGIENPKLSERDKIAPFLKE